MYDVIIIGAGVVGAFIARKFSQYNLKILILEKNNDVGDEISCANSAIIHSGYDPLPGTLKAKLNVLGNKMFDQLAKELDVDFERIGSLTVAKTTDSMDSLIALKKRGDANGVETKILSKEETLKLEPLLKDDIIGSLFAPSCGIIDPFNLVTHAIECAINNGVELHLEEEVISIRPGKEIEVTTNSSSYKTKVLVNSAGLQSANIAKLIDPNFDLEITPRKGQYYVLDNNISLVNHVCFALPNKLGKGVLVSKTTSGNFIIGPNNTLGDSLDDVSTDTNSLNEIKEKSLINFSSIPFSSTIRVFSGVRPSLESENDFYIKQSFGCRNAINLIGIDSPGLVSSPAIAEYVFDLLENILKPKIKKSFNPYVKKYIVMNNLSTEEKDKIIANDRYFGKIVCFCERISLGEIKNILSRNIPINSIKALKKRTRAGFGSCQGGFCLPTMVSLLSKSSRIKMEDILLDKNGSYILVGLAK